jgi:hypothetical protein
VWLQDVGIPCRKTRDKPLLELSLNKARLIITAITIEKLTQTEAARRMKAREPVLGTIG